MLIRGSARHVSLAETMTGFRIYNELVNRVESLNGPATSAGRLLLMRSVLLDYDFPPDTLQVVAMIPNGLPHFGTNKSKAIFGIRTPYPLRHVVVMPDLADQPGITQTTDELGSTFYSGEGETTDVTAGFEPDKKYNALALAVSEFVLLSRGQYQAHDPNIDEVNDITRAWAIALELEPSYAQ